MQAYKTICGGAEFKLKLKVGATVSNAGTICIGDGTNNYGETIPCTTTSFLDSYGISLDTATYSATQGDAEGIVTLSSRPDQIISARMSGSSTTGTDLTTLSNTSASAGGTTVTDADVGTADLVSGTVWCIGGANVGHSRIITTFNSATSVVVTVPFPRAIAVGDTFLFCPYSRMEEGASAIQTTGTDFLEADASITNGTGGVAAVTDLRLEGASDSYVEFIQMDHALAVATL